MNQPMRFYLGTCEPSWLAKVPVPLFISRRRLQRLKTLPRAITPWALDSGGFTELLMFGEWRTSPHTYVALVRRYYDQIGHLEWAAPQDWMCESDMLNRTGLTVAEHQTRTVDNYLTLRTLAADLPIVPTLQGWTVDDYLRHVDQYAEAGINLERLDRVGLGSVCRRQATGEAENIVQRLQPLKLHGFGMKTDAVHRFGQLLTSSDSMAWSYAGRRRPSPGCTKTTCNNCLHYALEWRERLHTPRTPTLFGIAS